MGRFWPAEIALSPTICALVSTNKGRPMTALQDWLSYRPMHPRTLKALICDTFRAQPVDQQAVPVKPAEPQLLRPGLERC
ncbi:hypothetical protein AU197_04915 [Mycobacterium sp. IS-1590]|nr:hypothetical protein AU197_04915 [Mycobacterium sp. IS-1590]